MVSTRTCCKDSWLALGWHCWICNRNGKTGTEDDWRGPFGVRTVEMKPRPGRPGQFTYDVTPDACLCGDVPEYIIYRARSSCWFCHGLGIRTVCRVLTFTFGDWGGCGVHERVFAYLYVPLWRGSGLRISGELDYSGLADWLAWVRKTFGEEHVTESPRQLICSN